MTDGSDGSIIKSKQKGEWGMTRKEKKMERKMQRKMGWMTTINWQRRAAMRKIPCHTAMLPILYVRGDKPPLLVEATYMCTRRVLIK